VVLAKPEHVELIGKSTWPAIQAQTAAPVKVHVVENTAVVGV
jgi:hypothetical protein